MARNYTVQVTVFDHDDRDVRCAEHQMEVTAETKDEVLDTVDMIVSDWRDGSMDFDCDPDA